MRQMEIARERLIPVVPAIVRVVVAEAPRIV